MNDYDYTLNRNQQLKKMITLIESGWDLLPEDRVIVVRFLNEIKEINKDQADINRCNEVMEALKMVVDSAGSTK